MATRVAGGFLGLAALAVPAQIAMGFAGGSDQLGPAGWRTAGMALTALIVVVDLVAVRALLFAPEPPTWAVGYALASGALAVDGALWPWIYGMPSWTDASFAAQWSLSALHMYASIGAGIGAVVALVGLRARMRAADRAAVAISLGAALLLAVEVVTVLQWSPTVPEPLVGVPLRPPLWWASLILAALGASAIAAIAFVRGRARVGVGLAAAISSAAIANWQLIEPTFTTDGGVEDAAVQFTARGSLYIAATLAFALGTWWASRGDDRPALAPTLLPVDVGAPAAL